MLETPKEKIPIFYGIFSFFYIFQPYSHQVLFNELTIDPTKIKNIIK